MLRQLHKNGKRGQAFLEYTMILGVIVMALVAMSPMIKRALQGVIKTVADEVGVQQNAEQRFDESGHLEMSYSSVRSSTDKTTTEDAGVIGYTYGDQVDTDSVSVSNLGFQEED